MAIQVVSFHCVLKNTFGQIIGTTYNQDVLVSQAPSQNQLKGLVAGLKDLQPGEKRKVRLRADEAYGYYDPQKVLHFYKDQLESLQPFRVGDELPLTMQGEKRMYRVIEILDDIVTLDGNHPLAGQDLVFEIEATHAREATPEDFSEAESILRPVVYH